MHKTVIFGAGGHARVISDIFNCLGVPVFGFVDDSPSFVELDGFPVYSSTDPVWVKLMDFNFVVAIGDNLVRASIFKRLIVKGGVPITVVHPSAVVSKRALIGPGSVVMAGAIVNPGATVGANCILNTSCSVDHDCFLEDHVHLCPGVRLAGNVRVGSQTMLGTGCCVAPGRNIGSNALIGAGAVVIKNLPDFCCAYGNPAQVRRFF